MKKFCPVCGQKFDSRLTHCPDDGTTLMVTPGAQDGLIGKVLKETYRIEESIGAGGMGAVYRAKQIQLDRDVAIKVLLPELRSNENLIKRFFREARLLSQINHPNIVSIIDFGNTDDGLVYMVMEYLNGQELYEYVSDDKGLGLNEIVGIMCQICAGVGAAHAYSLVHRDLKPSNVFLARLAGATNVVKVLDFGLVKDVGGKDDQATRTGEIMGTPGYIAPEQIKGSSEPDARTDIYALGGILYFMIAGHRPYFGQESFHTFESQLQGPPPPIDPSRFREPGVQKLLPLIEKAMSVDPDDRLQDTGEFIMAIDELAGIEGTIPDLSNQASAGDEEDPWNLKTAVGRSPSIRPTVPARPRPRSTTSQHTGTAPGGPFWRRGSSWHRRAVLGGAVGFLLIGLLAFLFAGNGPGTPNLPGLLGLSKDRPILLGMSAAFSGPARELGRGMQLGIETYLRAVNEQGGIDGRPIQVLALDDGYEPDRALANMRELIAQKKVYAIIGNVGTPTAKVAVPYAVKNRALFFGAFTGAGLLRKDPPDRYVFNYRASYAEETAAMVKYFVEIKKLKPSEIAVFAQNDSYGDAGFKGVARALRGYGYGAEDILRVGYQRNTIGVEDAVDEVLKAPQRARAIVMVGTYKPSARFIKATRDKGLEAIYANVSFVGSRALSEELMQMGPEYANGVIVTQVVPHYESQATGVIRYRQALKKYFPAEQPGFVSLEGYIAAQILVEGMRRAGAGATIEQLIDTLESIQGLDLGIGTILSFSPSRHQASHKVWGTVLNADGRYEVLELE